VVGLSALLAGLWLVPDTALKVLWSGVVPLLPALLLVSPALWRNVCPLATLDVVVTAPDGSSRLSPRQVQWGVGMGAVLLAVIVAARPPLFNHDGPALAGALATFAAVAVIRGRRYGKKAGFCNAICPLIPVERLYGQAPLIEIGNPHCPTCTLCAMRGCVDLSPAKVGAQLLGPSRRGAGWLLRPFGVFAAAFPGFVAGFFIGRGLLPLGQAAAAVGGAALSWLVAGALVLLGLGWRHLLRGSAALAAMAYYYFSATDLAAAWHWPAASVWLVRSAAFVLVVVWWIAAGRATRWSGGAWMDTAERRVPGPPVNPVGD